MPDEVSLFAYGSLTEGMVHFRLVSNYIVDRVDATISAMAYRLQVGYPVVLIPDRQETSNTIPGTLLKLKAPDLVYKLLDEFHGVSPLILEKSLFFKTVVKAKTARGTEEDAVTYVMNPAKLPSTAAPIIGGDWRQSLRETPAATTTLTEKQASYIKRLSQSSGREIVPIDLELYRELMKLDLIVDKGRRLALTKFGKEVARYLPE